MNKIDFYSIERFKHVQLRDETYHMLTNPEHYMISHKCYIVRLNRFLFEDAYSGKIISYKLKYMREITNAREESYVTSALYDHTESQSSEMLVKDLLKRLLISINSIPDPKEKFLFFMHKYVCMSKKECMDLLHISEEKEFREMIAHANTILRLKLESINNDLQTKEYLLKSDIFVDSHPDSPAEKD